MVSMAGLSDSSATAATNVIWYAKSCTKPSFQIATAEHKYLNHTFYFPGTVTWQDVSLTLVDPGGDTSNVAQMFTELIVGAGYAIPANEGYLGTITKSSMASAVGAVVISQLNGEGAAVESWTLKNALITEMKFGDLEYGSDELTEVSLTLKYDWAELVITDSSGTDSAALPTTATP